MLFRSFLLALLFHFFAINTALSQELKFGPAILQNYHQGAAPIIDGKYEVYFKKKKNQEISIDSIKSVADGKILPFVLFKKTADKLYNNYTGNKITRSEKGTFRINFDIVKLNGDGPWLAYTEENMPIQYDMSKGVRIYYSLMGERKSSILTTFKEYPTLARP